jgi:hypothetical protein
MQSRVALVRFALASERFLEDAIDRISGYGQPAPIG